MAMRPSPGTRSLVDHDPDGDGRDPPALDAEVGDPAARDETAVWHERTVPNVSQRMPCTRERTDASLDPTPTPRSVRSPRPVVDTEVTRVRPWNMTWMPPAYV